MDINESAILNNVQPNEVIEFLQRIVRINSENPPGNEKQIAESIAEFMNDFGCEVETQNVEGKRSNVIAILKGDNQESLLLNGHMDTVKIGNLSEWGFDPLGGQIKNNRLYGRGAADMKAGLASMIFSMKAIRDSGIKRKRSITLTAVIDEEVSLKGTKALIRENKIKHCKMGYVSEPTNLDIVLQHKGALEYKALVHGKYAHAGQAFLGVNAIYKMNNFINELKIYNDKLKDRMDLDILKYPTMTVTKISGGTGSTFVPDCCEAHFCRHVMPIERIEDVEVEVNNLVDGIVAKYDLKIDFEKLLQFNPLIIEKDTPVVKNIARSYRKIKDQDALYSSFNAYCEAELLNSAGIPTAVFGPGNIEMAHCPDEYVDIQQVIDATKTYALVGYQFVS